MLSQHPLVSIPVRVPKNPSVLVVDDDTLTRNVYTDLLAGAGFQTKTACSADEAFGIAKTADLDVIVLDIMMPGMDGLAALQEFNRILPNVPVIIVTSHSTAENAISALRRGAYDFIPKGFESLDLVQVVSQASQHRTLTLENQRLFSDLQDRVAQLTLINELSRLFGSTLDLQQILELVLKKAQQLLDCEASSLLLKDQKTEELYFLAARGRQVAQIPSIRLRKGEGVAGWVFEHGEPLFVPDVQSDPRFSPRVDEITKFVTRSILAVPVKVKEQTIAVIELVNPCSGTFQQRNHDLLMMITAQAGIAIENAKLYQDLRRQNEELLCLVRASQDLSASLEVEQIVQRITHHLTDLTPAARSGIVFLEPDGRSAILMAGSPGRTGHEVKVGARLDLSLYPEIVHVMRNRRPLHIQDVLSDSLMKPVHDLIRPIGLSSLLIIPIQDPERVFGVIRLAHFDPVHRFTSNDIAICQAFANQASIALQNARLYGELVRKTVQLVEANRHKSEFLANMSHELRTPLTAIIGFAELLGDMESSTLTAKQRKYVENIHVSGKHLLELINNILDLSKVEAGKLELELKTFPLVPTTEEVLSVMRPLSERKGLTLEVQLSEAPEELVADPGRFKQILYNLLSNAIKFTPAGGTVSLSAKLASGGRTPHPGEDAECRDLLEVVVRDTGIGIRLEDQERIFETFEQVDSSLSRQYQGTGLGLPLTKRLVELHGGQIEVESHPGCGSIFRFTLPYDRHPSA
jgi:signal transduction histidine kinase/FixJ family two-component response regulator